MRNLRRLTRVIGSCAVAAFWAAPALTVSKAYAQQYPYFDTSDPNVVIDLGVIHDGGFGAKTFVPGALPSSGGGQSLLFPGVDFPVSRVIASPGAERIQLKRPDSGVADQSGNPTETGMAPPPKKAPAKPLVAKSMDLPPPPTDEPEPARKSGKPVNIAPVNVASESMDKAPPPPPQIAVPTIAPPPAPIVAAKAPPPLPSSSVIKAPMPPAPSSMIEKTPPPPQTAAPTIAPPSPPQIAAPVIASPPVKQQQASLPAAGSPLALGQVMRVTFSSDVTMLPVEAKGGLDSLAAKLKEKEELRLQLLAYAGGGGLSASKARRLALSRALAVRSYLIEAGVRSTRIDVRALGDKAPDEPMNRVDLNIIDR